MYLFPFLMAIQGTEIGTQTIRDTHVNYASPKKKRRRTPLDFEEINFRYAPRERVVSLAPCGHASCAMGLEPVELL
jgi:hypothetical protein